jgi:hypothetical protein
MFRRVLEHFHPSEITGEAAWTAAIIMVVFRPALPPSGRAAGISKVS